MREIIIWGTGYQAQKLTEKLAGDSELYTDHVAAYGDNNESRQGGTFNGAPIIGAGDLSGTGYDYIVIAAAAIREIRIMKPKVKTLSTSRKAWELSRPSRVS